MGTILNQRCKSSLWCRLKSMGFERFISNVLLIIWFTPALANSAVDPTVCRPLDECLKMCQQHQGNLYADFVIPGEDCICPACNRINSYSRPAL